MEHLQLGFRRNSRSKTRFRPKMSKDGTRHHENERVHTEIFWRPGFLMSVRSEKLEKHENAKYSNTPSDHFFLENLQLGFGRKSR